MALRYFRMQQIIPPRGVPRNPLELSVNRTCNEWPLAYETNAQNKSKMEKQINLEVIDQMFAAQMSMNESEETMKALRPQVNEAVEELIRQRGLPRKFTGIIEYHGFKIRVQRPKSYTWELNTQLKDENLEYYKKQHAMYMQLQEDVKDLRRDMKRTGEKLEKAYPESESIKYGWRLAFIPA